MGFHKRDFKLVPSEEIVNGFEYENSGLGYYSPDTRRFFGAYQVIHIPTGMSIGRFISQVKCRGLIKDLVTLPIDWTIEGHEEVVKNSEIIIPILSKHFGPGSYSHQTRK